MTALLDEAIDAHGGLARWREFDSLSATLVTSGEFWSMKGLIQDVDPRRMTIDLHRQWACVAPFGDPSWHSEFTPARVAVVARDGTVIAERSEPRSAFTGHAQATPWDPLHRAYFNGYALWTYLSAPFVLAEPDFGIDEIPPVQVAAESWRGLRATFPGRIASHSRQQDFYFGPDGLLRRHDYHVDVAGGFAVAQLVSEHVEVQGLRFATRRRAYRRDVTLRPRPQPLMMAIDLGEFALA